MPANPPDNETRRDRGQDKGSGPNNPLPGEPGGPSTAGHSDADRKAAEEGQRRDDKAAKDHPDHSKR